MSEKALQMLSHSEIPTEIAAGLPTTTWHAQKFGEMDLTNVNQAADNRKELHSCGIIYFPKHPYTLCIMTKGTNFAKLATTLKDITALTYTFMTNKYH